MPNGWFASGWPSYLPQHQTVMVCMLFGTATVRGLRGAAWTTSPSSSSMASGAPSSADTEALLTPPSCGWTTKKRDHLESDQEKDQFCADAAEHRARCEGLLRAAGAGRQRALCSPISRTTWAGRTKCSRLSTGSPSPGVEGQSGRRPLRAWTDDRGERCPARTRHPPLSGEP
ncbi:DUF6042 family protein [Streptomyces sp. NPDC089795]|uniref:DUF6042 family protein n=1 Tax=Streptomyces sp. NPDC089795 TaxID=3155297 RepID=UPI0034388186